MTSAGEGQSWTVLPLLKTTAEYFSGKGIASARLDAEVLLAAVLGVERIQLYARHEEELVPEHLSRYREYVSRRAGHEPVAYILGRKEFYSRDFAVNREVLVPRPETEHLVDEALRILSGSRSAAPRILDIGTGSGCIAVTIACECREAGIVATDISLPALKVARENADRYGVGEQIDFRQGDFYLPLAGETFDLIVSNPPYIAEGDDAVMADVARYEPHGALYAGADGLESYRVLVAELQNFLSDDGMALFELGAGQADEVTRMARAAGFEYVDALADHSGIERVLRISLQPLTGSGGAVAGDYVYEPLPEQSSLMASDSGELYRQQSQPGSESMLASEGALGYDVPSAEADELEGKRLRALNAALDAYAEDEDEEPPVEPEA